MINFFKSKSLLTEEQFSKKFFKELSKIVKGLKLISINSLEIETEFNNNKGYKHFLNNSYTEYKADRKNINEILMKYLNGAKEIYLPEKPVNIDRIVPIIKDKRYLIETSKIAPDYENTHIYEKYNSELYIFYAEDKENSISYLTKEKIENLGIERAELKNRSIKNLGEIITKIERHGENGYFMITAGGDYESSLILFNIWENDNMGIVGELLIGIPSRDILLVTGKNNKENVAKLIDTVNEINQNGDHLVSDKIYEFTNEKFEVWKKSTVGNNS